MSGSASTGDTPPAVTTPGSTGAAPGGGAGDSSVGGSTSGLTTPTLPPQYATGNEGFYTRQIEYVTTGVTIGPDGALYTSGLTAIPYPTGYSSVYRIADPTVTTGFDGNTPSGVPQTYASGFTQPVSLAFNNSTGDLYVLDYLNGGSIYDPTLQTSDLPPSQLIKAAPNGVRTTLSGPELRFANYVTVDQNTGDVYVAINNDGPSTATSPGTGEVLKYRTDAATGATSYAVVASGLDNPRGMSFGPDGNLYVLESGSGTPTGTPGADTAPVIPFLPGLVSERGGYTGSITRVDVASPAGGQERIFTGLPSFREFNPTTGEDRIISIGPNALTITADGTVFIAGGGGLAPETAAAVGSFADGLGGVVKLTGLFGPDPSQATYSTAFDTLAYAAANGPDGETTLFNTESNPYDITQGPDGELYVADAARNLVYGFSSDGTRLDSVTVQQKQPPVLTPPQYAAVVAAGGDPTAQYAAEISNVTFKGPGGLPDVPGTLPPNPALSGAGPFSGAPPGSAPPGSAPTGAPPDPTSTGASPPDGSSTGPSVVPGESGPPSGAAAYPGPSDPITPPVLPDNVYTNYYNPFFGNYAPAPSDPLDLPDGNGGPATMLSMLTPGESWTWALSGQFTPPEGGQELPLSGTMNQDVEVLPFQGGTSLAFVSTQNLTLPDGTSLFGGQPQQAIFYFNQDPTTGTVYVTGDNQGPDGATRVPENPIVFIPGQWSLATSYDNPLVFASGETEDISLNVTGTTSVTTPLGTFDAWVAPTNAVGSGVSRPGLDYWTPELGAPAEFTTSTQLPDGSSISITAEMTATTALPSSGGGQGGNGGTYNVSRLVVFGDRLADNGNTAALQKSLGQAPGTSAPPYSETGNFSDGPQWTTDLAQLLGATDPAQQQNFAYVNATARDLGVPNPFDPNADQTTLDTFAGQVAQFAQQDGSFTSNDLVTVTFGGNDITLPITETPEQGVTDSVNAIISGLGQLADLGAKHFLVSNLPDITLTPLFSNPDFYAATDATQAQFQGLVSAFNSQLAAGLDTFESQTGLDVKTLDLNTLFNGIVDDPLAYGFTNISQPVLVSTPNPGTAPVYNPAIVGEDPQVEHGSLFLDPYFDPTALGQAIIAQTARSTLTA